MAGQSIGDRLVAAQHTIMGSDVAKIVCKASTSEAMPPKKKHLDYLLAMVKEPNVNLPELANCLVERTKQLKWVVVFKALITTHHLMFYGSERFLQHLASRNGLFSLGTFLDRTGKQSYEMSQYLRRYAMYLNQKALSYRAVAYDFTRVKRGKDGFFRRLESEKLLKALPIIQQQLDYLIDFDANPSSINNGIIMTAFVLLFKDLIRIFACYNDGIINLLEIYFNMNKNQCREAIDIYKKFMIRMNKISEMLKVAKEVGIDNDDIPKFFNAPNSLLESLEQHLAYLENKKSERKHSSATTSNQLSIDTLNASLYHFEENTCNLPYTDVDANFASEPQANSCQQTSSAQEKTSPSFSGKLENLMDIFAFTPPSSSPTPTSTSNPFSSSFTAITTNPLPTQQFQTINQHTKLGLGMQQPLQQQQHIFTTSPQAVAPDDLFDVQQGSSTFGGPHLQQPFQQQQQPVFSAPPHTVPPANLFDVELAPSTAGGAQLQQPFQQQQQQPVFSTTPQTVSPANLFDVEQAPSTVGRPQLQQPFQQQQQLIFSTTPQTVSPVNLRGVQQQGSTGNGAQFTGSSLANTTFASTEILQPEKTEQKPISLPMSLLSSSQPSNSGLSLESSLTDLNLKEGRQKANLDFQPKETKLTGGANFNPSTYTSITSISPNPISQIGLPINPLQNTMFGSVAMTTQPMVIQQPNPAIVPFQQLNQPPLLNRSVSPKNPFLE